MKDIRKAIVDLLKGGGYSTPKIAGLATRLREPPTTIHYNIKRLEEEGVIRTYKAVFDYKKIEEGFCAFVLVNLTRDEYGSPEKVGKEIAKLPHVESVDVITGDWELIIKVRNKDIDEYYQFIKNVLSRKGIAKTTSLSSLKQLKSEFIEF